MALVYSGKQELATLFPYLRVHYFVDSLIQLIQYFQGNNLQTLKSVLNVIKWTFESFI